MTEQEGKGGKMPRLTIMEEVLLLGLKDKQVGPSLFFFLPSFLPGTEFRHGVTADGVRIRFHALRFLPGCHGHAKVSLVLLRDTFHSGMTTYHMLYEGAFS